MRVQSWRCGLWGFCFTLCFSVRTLSVVWRRSCMPNSSHRSPSLQVILLFFAVGCKWFLIHIVFGCHKKLNYHFCFQKQFLQLCAEMSLSMFTLRAAWGATWAAAPWSHPEDDTGPTAAAVLDQPADFPGRVHLDRGGPCESELL